MKNKNGIYIIGVDHGYGNIKTANCCFPTGVESSDTEPTFKNDLLIYQPIIPEAIFLLLEKIGQLQDLTASPEADAAICTLLKEISDTLLLPRKEAVPWPLPDSGL